MIRSKYSLALPTVRNDLKTGLPVIECLHQAGLEDEQLAFWKALTDPPVLTPAQRQLGEQMRGSR
jgi:hypothetical protein